MRSGLFFAAALATALTMCAVAQPNRGSAPAIPRTPDGKPDFQRSLGRPRIYSCSRPQ